MPKVSSDSFSPPTSTAYFLLLFLKNQKDMHPYVSLGWKESLGKDVTG